MDRVSSEAEELQKAIELPPQPVEIPTAAQAGTAENTQPNQQTRETAGLTLQMLAGDPAPTTRMEADVMQAFQNASLGNVQLTPQEKVFAYQPKNAYEARLKDLTLYKYKVLDCMSRHPEAMDICLKLISGAAKCLQAAKYIGAGIVGFAGGAAGGSVLPGAGTVTGGVIGATNAVSGVYAVQTGTEAAMETTVETTSNALASQITTDSALQKEFAGTIKICEFCVFAIATPKAVKAVSSTLKTQATALKSVHPLTGRARTVDPSTVRLDGGGPVHLNSNQYTGECKLYEIFRESDRKVMKIGETARGYDASGKLIRPWEQCQAFEKTYKEKFKYRELGTFGSKAEVRAAETKTILERRAADPNALPLNKGVH